MIVCKGCGYRNADKDTFCGACGKFLEWNGERVTIKVDEAVVAQAKAEIARPRPGFLQRVTTATARLLTGPPPEELFAEASSATGSASGSAGPVAGPPAAAGPSAPPVAAPPAPPAPPVPQAPPAPPVPRVPGPPPPAAAKPQAARKPPPAPGLPPSPPAPGPPSAPPSPPPAPGEALIAPVEAGEARAAEPAELAPQTTVARVAPVRRTTRARDLRPGDLVCGDCGTGNAPVRKFCARCGHPLADAEVVRTPWWRRVFRRRGAKVLKVGARARKRAGARSRSALRQTMRKTRAVIGVLIILGGIAYGAYPPLRAYVNDHVVAAKQQLFGFASGQLVPIHPVSVTADVALPGHAGQLATDDFTNTYWDAPWSGPGATNVPNLTLSFGKNVILRQLVVYSGASDDYTAHDRPALLELRYSNSESDFVNLADTANKQQLTLHNGLGVTSVQIKVLDVYAAQNSADLAISELELFGL